jgi:hypothetical protein
MAYPLPIKAQAHIPVFSEKPITHSKHTTALIFTQRSQVHYFHKKSGTSITSVARLMRRLFMIANSREKRLKKKEGKLRQASALSI